MISMIKTQYLVQNVDNDFLVYLVVPEGCEHKVHLNEDAAKGKKPTHQWDNRRCKVPLPLRNRSWNSLYSAGIVRSPTPVSPNHRTQKHQGKRDESPKDKHDNHCTEWYSCQWPVEDSNCIQCKANCKMQERKEGCCKDHRLYPVFTCHGIK